MWPVPPAGSYLYGAELYAGPAMSICAHGVVFSRNAPTNSPALELPPNLPPLFLISAISDLLSSRYS